MKGGEEVEIFTLPQDGVKQSEVRPSELVAHSTGGATAKEVM